MTDIKRGLEGVVVDSTQISKVMPEINALVYWGYPVQDLAEKTSFEEVAYLLWQGELPARAQLDALSGRERAEREISAGLVDVMRALPKDAHPMDALRTGVSFLGTEDPTAWDNSAAANQRKAELLLAKIPTIVATQYRLSRNQERIPPRTDLSIAENFFHMCFGEVPSAEIVKAFDVSLVLYAEHGFNASTFTARVIASTLSDMYSAVSGAIGALKGPLHGGANEAVMHMLEEIGEPDNAREWLLQALQEKRKVMGFGHRVYKRGDSRVPTMHAYAQRLATATGGEKWMRIADTLETTMLEQKNIHPNLDFPAGPAYYMMGFPIEVFTPIFVMSRVTGWTAHIMEQHANNRIIRPLCDYHGPSERRVVPIEER